MNINKIISYIFHPVLFSTIAAVLFFIIQPKFIPKELEYSIISVVIISTYIIPVFFLFILRKKNAINSFHLETIDERKFPILFFIILNLLLGLRLYNIHIVSLLSITYIAVSLALIIVFLLFFIKIKTSLHTMGIGALIGFLIILSYHYQIRILLLIASVFLLYGFVSMARLKLKAHNQAELLLGVIIGIVTQLITYVVIYKI